MIYGRISTGHKPGVTSDHMHKHTHIGTHVIECAVKESQSHALFSKHVSRARTHTGRRCSVHVNFVGVVLLAIKRPLVSPCCYPPLEEM